MLSAFTLFSLFLNPASASSSLLAFKNCSAVNYSNGWVAQENFKPGDKNWQDIVKHGKSGTVSGWFDKTSVACGDTVGLHLTGNNRAVTLKIFRMGYYGGAGARLIYSKSLGKVAPASKPIIANDPTHLTTTNWATTTTIKIDSNYPTGIYMARFDDGSKAGYAPLVVRNDAPTPGLLIVAGDITWEGYNTYGGWSLYHGPDATIYDPGRMVSFNRPYDRDGKSNFTIYDAGIVQEAESLGLNVNYTDDVYINSNPSSLLGHTAVIYNGHTEYWTANMFKASVEARDSGVNLVFFGANSAYWKTRLVNGDRDIIVWKNGTQDPNINNPALVTDKWGMGPVPSNNSTLLGALYAGILSAPVNYTVQDANVWPIKGTGLKSGDVIAGVVGKEVETTDMGQAPAVQSFLTSKVVSIEDPRTWNVGLIYYTVPSKAGVINVSSMGWVCSMTDTCSWKSTANSKTASQVKAITKQILIASAMGPLGVSHPMVANIPARTALQPICVLSCTNPNAAPDKN